VRVGNGTSIGTAPWSCTTYDVGGRMTDQTWPASNGAPARSVSYTYSVGGNPLVSSVTDSNGIITSTVDLLGRVVSYTDASGQTTTSTYNQAGQTTASNGPNGDVQNYYDPNSGQVTAMTVNNSYAADVTYCGRGACTGLPTYITYSGNGSAVFITYDAYGKENSVQYVSGDAYSTEGGDQATYAPGGQELIDEPFSYSNGYANPNPSGGNDFTYDGAGRLTQADLPGQVINYSYANNVAGDGCASPDQGANTNLTSVTTTPSNGSPSTTDSCYNGADQLVSTVTSGSSTSPTSTDYLYDTHGNQTADAGTTYTWDASDRLASATSVGTTDSYTYDALNRVLTKTTGTTPSGYAYCGFTDSPCAVLNANNTVSEDLATLPGGVLLTLGAVGGPLWSEPDLQGNYIATLDIAGSAHTTNTYTPFGAPGAGTQTPFQNAGPGSTLGAFGADGKITDSSLANPIVLMGARPYNPAEGRFLSVDPIEGGCANAYVYVRGDPLNSMIWTGRTYATFSLLEAP
jgi:RHS repeat-associated protein